MDLRHQIDLLSALALPDRYERLVERLGVEVANLLVAPSGPQTDALAMLAQEVRTRDEGVLVPLSGPTGTGKSTLASSLVQWAPADFSSTLTYEGPITFDSLVAATRQHAAKHAANDSRIVPINIDHRESAPPDDAELASLKRFLRKRPAGVPTIVLWPETTPEVANRIAERYITIAGQTSAKLPIEVTGPPREAWVSIAKNTLLLANRISDLEHLGVDPGDYDVHAFRTLGDFLRKISMDFNARLQGLKASLQKPIQLAIVFASESTNPGVLSGLTNSSIYGLLDGGGLLSATPDSEIGKWWSGRRGLLTRAIVTLNAHAYHMGPGTAVSALRNCGPQDMPIFEKAGVARYGAARAARDLGRAEVGQFLLGEPRETFEGRGTPPKEAAAAFAKLADSGFTLGRDKSLNKIMAAAGNEVLTRKKKPPHNYTAEEGLQFCGLIPDNAFYFPDHVKCLEFTWRKGQFLATANRSTVAQYILTKLQKYVRQLGWTTD